MPTRVATPTDRGCEPRNRLLAALPDRTLRSLQLLLEAVPLVGGSVLFDVDEPLQRVYFVDSGAASLVTAFENRVGVGVATVGREGVVGAPTLLLGGQTALSRARVLVPGSARAMAVSVFRGVLRNSPKFRAVCEAYTRALFVQLLQAVPCNRLHTVEQRCARWLLMCADRTEGDTFEFTPEGFAELLGVPQPRLTVVTRKLQGAELICCRGDAITVLDRRGLESVACECYRIVRDRYERVLAPTRISKAGYPRVIA
jgi:CRP-like cAMP-binding protein